MTDRPPMRLLRMVLMGVLLLAAIVMFVPENADIAAKQGATGSASGQRPAMPSP